MFDGTDLSLAYGGSQGQDYDFLGGNSYVQEHNPVQPPLPKSTQSHSLPPEPVYTPPPQMFQQQTVEAPKNSPLVVSYQPSFWDKLTSKRPEVIKYIMLSFVIVLGISFDRVITHYVTTFLSKNVLTELQEFLVRLSYPLTVIIVLWIIKATV